MKDTDIVRTRLDGLDDAGLVAQSEVSPIEEFGVEVVTRAVHEVAQSREEQEKNMGLVRNLFSIIGLQTRHIGPSYIRGSAVQLPLSDLAKAKGLLKTLVWHIDEPYFVIGQRPTGKSNESEMLLATDAEEHFTLQNIVAIKSDVDAAQDRIADDEPLTPEEIKALTNTTSGCFDITSQSPRSVRLDDFALSMKPITFTMSRYMQKPDIRGRGIRVMGRTGTFFGRPLPKPILTDEAFSTYDVSTHLTDIAFTLGVGERFEEIVYKSGSQAALDNNPATDTP